MIRATENIECRVCKQGNNIRLLEKRLSLYKCASCCHTFTLNPEENEIYDDAYYKAHKNWFENPDYNLFSFIHNEIERLNRFREKSILDIGCGKGNFLKYIADRNPDVKLTGIDFTLNHDLRINFIKGDFIKIKIEAKFNTICSLAVIEHVEDPNLFVQKINKLLLPNGIIFIMTVNNNSLIYRIARILNRVGIRVAHDRLYSHHHLQHFTNQSLKTLLQRNGFVILSQINHNSPLKAVDLPETHYFIKRIFQIGVGIIYTTSILLGMETLQTVICEKPGTEDFHSKN